MLYDASFKLSSLQSGDNCSSNPTLSEVDRYFGIDELSHCIIKANDGPKLSILENQAL